MRMQKKLNVLVKHSNKTKRLFEDFPNMLTVNLTSTDTYDLIPKYDDE